MKKLYLSIVALCFSAVVTAQTASFNITYNGFTPQAEAAFQYAANIWSNTLVSPVPIKVIAHFQLLLPGMLGITFPNGVKDFAGAPMDSTWYGTALANSITGIELNPGQADIEMYLNSTSSWYYDTTGTVPAGQYDLATIVLHELCHGLGFLSLAKNASGTGSFGLLTASDFAPLTTSFPWPQLDTLPSIFDRFLVNNLGARLDTFINPSAELALQFTGNNIFFNGPFALMANSGNPAKIYAPATFSLGSSVTHLDEATYPAGDPNELMTPNGTPAYSLHTPGPICIGILKDIGWNLNTTAINEMANNKTTFSIYPNPAHNMISLTTSFPKEKIKTIEVKNILGSTILTAGNTSVIDVADLPSGIYFIIITADDFQRAEKFVKE